MDLSQLSDDDLRRLANNDYSKLSDEAKTMFKQPASEAPATADTNPSGIPTKPMAPGEVAGPVEPGMMSQAADFAVNNIVTPVVGAAQTAAQYGLSNPLLTGGAALGAAKYGAVKNLVGEGLDAWRNNNITKMADRINIAENRGQSVDTLKKIYEQQSQRQLDRMAAQQAAQNQPSIIQRGMDTASRMRQLAAQRVAGFAASGAAVPAAVAAGGAAATSMAGNQMAAMTPEQRRAYYDSMLMGAMSGDAGLAAAIMNRGQ